jgi:3-oxoacyl-[acyl-carrier protein] reductase
MNNNGRSEDNMSAILKGRVAVVTGSGQGIGRAIAFGLAAAGAKVVTNNRQPKSTGRAIMSNAQVSALDKKKRDIFQKETEAISGDAETAAQEIRDAGGEAAAFFGDVSRFEVAEKLIQSAIDSFGKIDILVNNAGAFGFSPVEKMTMELWDKVNLIKPRGYFATIRHALPYMIKQKWGRIINCSSKAFTGDIIKHAEYCTANAGVVGLTKAVAIEMREHGITCNAFTPFARTRADYEIRAYTEVVDAADSPWVGGKVGPMFQGIAPTSDYTAPFICYLASDAAANISGSVFSVGGNNIGLYSDPVISRSLTKFGKEPWTLEELMQQVPRGLLGGYHAPADNL